MGVISFKGTASNPNFFFILLLAVISRVLMGFFESFTTKEPRVVHLDQCVNTMGVAGCQEGREENAKLN